MSQASRQVWMESGAILRGVASMGMRAMPQRSAASWPALRGRLFRAGWGRPSAVSSAFNSQRIREIVAAAGLCAVRLAVGRVFAWKTTATSLVRNRQLPAGPNVLTSQAIRTTAESAAPCVRAEARSVCPVAARRPAGCRSKPARVCALICAAIPRDAVPATTCARAAKSARRESVAAPALWAS